MKTVFYRIENSEGKGAFSCGGLTATKYLDNNNNLTPPEDDFEDVFGRFSNVLDSSLCSNDWFFGCLSISDIDSWFNSFESVAYLKMNGCRVYKYQIDDQFIKKGKNQIIFIKEKATLISSKPLEPLRFPKAKDQTTHKSAKFSHFLELNYS